MSDPIVRMKLLKKGSWDLAYRFHAKVYLVGSYVRDEVFSHDIDVYLVLTNDRYDRLFSMGENRVDHDKVRTFRSKQKLYLEQFVTDKDIDFKVEFEGAFFDHRGDRILLAEYNTQMHGK